MQHMDMYITDSSPPSLIYLYNTCTCVYIYTYMYMYVHTIYSTCKVLIYMYMYVQCAMPCLPLPYTCMVLPILPWLVQQVRGSATAGEGSLPWLVRAVCHGW